MRTELLGYKKTPVPNRGLVPGRSEVVQPLRSRGTNISQIIVKAAIILFLTGCKMSDYTEELPGGHTYVDEGHCYKYILINIKNASIIESCVTSYKYNDDYITVAQEDPVKCEHPQVLNKAERKFFIIDVKKEKVLGPYNNTGFITNFNLLQLDKKLFIN